MMKTIYKTFVILLYFMFASAAFADENENISKETNAVSEFKNNFEDGIFSFDAAFPYGGSLTTNQVAGGRVIISSFSLGVYIQASVDKNLDKKAYGGILRLQNYFYNTGRSLPYMFIQGSVGENTTGDETENVSGAATGFGVEIFLLPELSTSLDVGVAANFAPENKNTFSTTTGQLGIHYYFNLFR